MDNSAIKEKIERASLALFDACRKTMDVKEVDDVKRAFDFAHLFLGESVWASGEVRITHSAEVARIVCEEINLGTDSVIAGLLHHVADTRLERPTPFDEVGKKFGQRVATILRGLAKINALDTDSETAKGQAENFRSLMLTLAGDIRVVLVKIADRLHVMRTLDVQNKKARKRLSEETTYLYAPMAHRLGLYNINSELLDLCLKYLKPRAYNHICDRLVDTESERRSFVAEFVKPIAEKLKARGFRFEMKARTKSVNSILNKMRRQKIGIDEVYDLFAIRIIIDSKPEMEKSECWQVYSIVTEEYQANPERMRDWITVPKSNGYESLHTTVLGPHRKWVEVQIRTKRMDEVAEKGLAAHWKYKGGQSSPETEKWLAHVREILENPDINVIDFLDELSVNIYSDEIFVFTPKGELKRLPKGASLLDFAYEVHSQVGDRCVGGVVDGKKVTLRYKLKNGEQITVNTSNNQRPKLDWLDFVITTKARNRIRASLNEERKKEADNGKEILMRKFKNWKIDFNDENIRKLLKYYQLKLAQDLYYNVSKEKIDTLEIKSILTGREAESNVRQRLEEIIPRDQVREMDFSGGDDYLVIDNNIKSVNHKLAPCCNPILGDDIFGFVTIRDGIKIHRRTCPNARQMAERYPYRIIPARWRDSGKRTSFQATLRLSGTDETGIVAQISHVIAKDVGVQMRSINIDSNNGEFEGILRIYVNDIEHLDFLMKKLKSIKGVLHVTRHNQ